MSEPLEPLQEYSQARGMLRSQMHGAQVCVRLQEGKPPSQATLEILPQQPVKHGLDCKQEQIVQWLLSSHIWVHIFLNLVSDHVEIYLQGD